MSPPAIGIRNPVLVSKKGGVSERVRLDDGWQLVDVSHPRPAATSLYTDVRGAIPFHLRAQRTQVARQPDLAKAHEQHRPSINEVALSRVLAESK